MKSGELEHVMRVARAILTDAALAYPRAAGFRLDSIRLSQCAKARGISVFTLDLPSLDEYLLGSLDTGKLVDRPGFLTKGKSKGDRRPRFLHDLWSLVFDTNGMLYESVDPNAILFLRQIFLLGKKLALSCSPARTQKSVEDYHDIEAHIIAPSNDWSSDVVDWKRCSFERSFLQGPGRDELPFDGRSDRPGLSDALRRLDKLAGIVAADFGMFSVFGDARVDRYQHGPGAVADLRGSDYKFDFPNWPSKLDGLFPFDWCGSSTLDCEGLTPSRHEPPSKLIAVPKTAKGPRLIASEPTAHQWCQQWLKNELVARSRELPIGQFIDFADQSLSAEMVIHASKTRSLSTLDLSSASDRVSCRHVECLFAANRSLLDHLHAVRTRWVKDSISSPARFLVLKKFAAMGSALTFPVQSIFFLCVCLAASGAYDRRSMMNLKGKVRVFGDDLIVPTEAYASTVSLLTHLGLVVNPTKSFSQGYFRESCGQDAYRGDDVTPIKPKVLWCHGPESYQSLVDTSNNLHFAGFWHAAREVASIATYRRFSPMVVGNASGLPGLTSYLKYVPMKVKWDNDLQIWTTKVVSLISRRKQLSPVTSAGLLQHYTAPFSAERPRTVGQHARASAVLAYVRREVTLPVPA